MKKINTNTQVKNKRAILYLRYSDHKQDGGTTIATQEQICRNSCLAEGFAVADVVKNEARSADKNKSTDRITELLDFCKTNRHKFEVLMVYKLDRFARSQAHHHWLRAKMMEIGIILRSATERIDETASGQLIEGVLAAFNEYDNEVKRERVSIAMWKRVDQGLWPWPAAIGYKADPHKPEDIRLVPHVFDEKCCSSIKQIFIDYSQGLGKTVIAKSFSTKTVVDHKGRRLKLTKQTIDTVLKNPYYLGLLRDKDGKLVKGRHIALVTPELWQKCQEVQNSSTANQLGHQRSRLSEDFPLRGCVKCGYCNKPLTAAFVKPEHSEVKIPYYWCRNTECPGRQRVGYKDKQQKSIKKHILDDIFAQLLGRIKPSDELVERFEKRFVALYKRRRGNPWGVPPKNRRN